MSETNKMNKLILNGQNIDLSPDYQNIRNKPTINGVPVDGNKTLDEFGIATKQEVENISEKVNKLPTGYYYGQFDSVNSLPDASQLTQRGYAYIASEDSSVYYIYLFDGEGSSWQDSGNKFVTTELETNLSTKSQTKAPTTKAVAEGIEAVNLTTEKSLTDSQKYTTLVNINDRNAEINSDTNDVERYAYKLLNADLSITNQILNDNSHKNTIYEIRDKFDLNNATLTIPSGCILRFNGGTISNGKINGNSTKIEASNYQIFYNISFSGSFSDSLNACWVGARDSNADYDNSPILQKWFGGTFESPSPASGWCRYWKVIKWPTGTYYFKSQVSSGEDNSSYNRFLCLDMDNSIFKINIAENVNSDTKNNPSFLIINVENFTLRNGQIRNGATSGTGDFSRVNCINILDKGQRFTLENITISNFDAGIYLYNLWYGTFTGQCNIIYNRVGVFVRGTLDFNTVDFNGIVMKPASLVTTIQKYPMIVGEPVTFEALGEVNINNSTYKYGPVSTLYKPRQRLIIWDSQKRIWKLVNNSSSSYKNTSSSSQTLYLSEEYIGNNNEDESLVVHIEGGENIEEKVYSPFTDSNTSKTTINNRAFIKSFYDDNSSKNQKITLAPNYTVKYNLMKALDVAKVRLARYSSTTSTYSVLSYKTGFKLTANVSYTVVSSDLDATEALISLNGEEQVIPLTRPLTIGSIEYRASVYNALQITATPETPVIIKYNHNPNHLISHTDNLNSKIIDIENITYNDIYIPITNAVDTSTLKYFVDTESYDEWMLRKGRVGIDVHTFTSTCKFRGLTIEGFDYGMRFNWRALSGGNGSEKSIINIYDCYFEKNTTYDLYFGKGWLDNTNNYNYIYRFESIANVYNNKFNSSENSGNRIYFEYGSLVFRNNETPHGQKGVSLIESSSDLNYFSTSITNESDWKVVTKNSEYSNIKDINRRNTVKTLGFAKNGYLGSNANLDSNLYLRADVVLENDKYNKTQSLPLNKFVYANYTASTLYTFRKNSIKTGSTVNISDGIDSFPIINVSRSSYPFAYVHSGRNVIVTNLDSDYAAISQTIDGIPIKEFIARWQNGISYTGLVQGLFPYEVVASPSTGLIKRKSDNVIVGFGNYYLANSKYIDNTKDFDLLLPGYYVYIDALIIVNVPSNYNQPRYHCDLVQCGRLYNEVRPADAELENSILISDIQDTSTRTNFVNRILFSMSDGKTYIYTSSATWNQLTSPFSRYTFQAAITKKANRPLVADYQGETCFCKSTGITYTFAFKSSVISTQNATWYGSIGTVFSLEHPNNYDASTNPITYATELDAGEMVRYNGKIYSWNGSAFTDINGNLLSNIQVSDKSVLLEAAADSSQTIGVYTSDTPTSTVNADASSWLSASLNGTTLTITATANTSNNPRGGKIILTNTNDEVVINVVQNYV